MARDGEGFGEGVVYLEALVEGKGRILILTDLEWELRG